MKKAVSILARSSAINDGGFRVRIDRAAAEAAAAAIHAGIMRTKRLLYTWLLFAGLFHRTWADVICPSDGADGFRCTAGG